MTNIEIDEFVKLRAKYATEVSETLNQMKFQGKFLTVAQKLKVILKVYSILRKKSEDKV